MTTERRTKAINALRTCGYWPTSDVDTWDETEQAEIRLDLRTAIERLDASATLAMLLLAEALTPEPAEPAPAA